MKAWVFPRGMTPFQRARKGFASVAWSIIILRVSMHQDQAPFVTGLEGAHPLNIPVNTDTFALLLMFGKRYRGV